MADDYAGNGSTVAQLLVGGQGNGSIETAADADWFGLNLVAGTTYLLYLRGFNTGGGTLGRGDAVPYLALRDGAGALLRADAGGGPGDDPVIVFTPVASGGYFLDVQELQNSGTGTYILAVSEAASVLRVNLPVAHESSGVLVFTLSLNKALAMPATVRVTTSTDGLADPRHDFVAKSETVTFAPGQTLALFTVLLNDDAGFEPTESLTLSLSSPVGLAFEEVSAFGLVVDNDAPYALPGDPLLPLQWALYPGAGANVLPLWPDVDGTGVRVGVFDQGIETSHPDLGTLLPVAVGRNTVNGQPGGGPLLVADSHGTAVAGVIAAERNGYLGVGVAYGAELVSLYSPLAGSDAQLAAQITSALQNAALPLEQGGVHVLNMGWGFWPEGGRTQAWPFADNFRSGPFAAAGQALRVAAEQGRDGLGTVVVQPAGNSAGLTDNTNLHNLQNSRYVITVGSTAYDGNATSASAPGASVLVAAPGGGGGGNSSTIVTTDRAGSAGYSADDWVPVAGTALAAPVVSGTVALMLQANPALGWRDVQQILAYTARQSGDEQNTWQFNRAGNWNGGGLHYDDLSHDLGLGLVDARAATRLAESWRGPALTSANQLELRSSLAQPAAIPDANGVLVQSLNLRAAIDIERVEVTINLTHAQPGELSLQLTAPGGSSSWLLSAAGQTLAAGAIDFTFSSVLHWGESGAGEWQLAVFDQSIGNTGQLLSWSLNLVGKPDSADDVYIYTDEFARAAGVAPERALLSDNGGFDTLNAAALSSASLINLNPGTASRIGGQALNLAAGTAIEAAFGGDGNDTLTGNPLANLLYGMRGNDSIDGGAGVDTGGFIAPRAQATLAQTPGGWTVTSPRDGTDTLQAVERLRFADVSVALDISSGGVLGAGHAGVAARAVNALLGKAYVSDKNLMGAVLDLLDKGMSHAELVNLGVNHPLFATLAGAGAGPVSATQFVRHVYFNVVGQYPDADTLAYYAGILSQGEMTLGQLGLLASETDINAGTVNLVGLASTGLEYLPLG